MTAIVTPSVAGARRDDTSLLVWFLAVAAVVELAILRVFTRTAVHIPALHSLQGPYKVVSSFGEYAYYLTWTLVVPALVLIGVQLVRDRAPIRHLAIFGMLLFAGPLAMQWLGGADVRILDFATIGSVVALVAVPPALRWRRQALPLVCFGAAFAASGAYTALPTLAQPGATIEQPAWLLQVAEVLGLGFALSAPLLVDSWSGRTARWAAISATALVLVMFLGNGSTSRFLLLWNAGLSGPFPGILYATAAGTLTLACVGLLRSGRRLEAAGLLLLISGGIGLHSTYQSALVVTGLAALAYAAISQSRAAMAGSCPVRQ